MLQEIKASYVSKFDSPMAAYMYDRLSPQDADEDASHEGWGWVGRYGRRILSEDSQGFVELVKHDDEHDAVVDFAEMTAGWYDEDDED